MLTLARIKIRGIECYQVNDPILIPDLDVNVQSRLIISKSLASFPVRLYPKNPNPWPVCWSVVHQYRYPDMPWSDDNIAGIWECEIEYEWYGTSEREIRDFYQID
jgi:hypothetical protein